MNSEAFSKSDPNRPRTYYLPRLPREYYQADAVVHWTLTVFDQAEGWLSDSFHTRFRELMLHAAAREHLFCPTYCLMPNHLHLVWLGLTLESDQFNGMSFLRTYLEPALAPAKFQPQVYDRVLRAEQRRQNAFSETCGYILQNPVKAHLVNRREEWRFNGAIVPGYPTLYPLAPDFWEMFWGIYAKRKAPDAGNIRRQPFNFIKPSPGKDRALN